MRLRGLAFAGTSLVLLIACGCQPQSKAPPVRTIDTTSGQGQPQAQQVISNPNVATTEFNDLDPCAGRLHDIEGQLLSYYIQKHRWPDTLQELRGYASPGEETDYTCPVSRQPYVYVRGGLVKPGKPEERLMVYDATPAHKGMRYGIIVMYPGGGQAMHTTVIGIPEPLFAGYAPAPAIQPATLPARRPRERSEDPGFAPSPSGRGPG